MWERILQIPRSWDPTLSRLKIPQIRHYVVARLWLVFIYLNGFPWLLLRNIASVHSRRPPEPILTHSCVRRLSSLRLLFWNYLWRVLPRWLACAMTTYVVRGIELTSRSVFWPAWCSAILSSFFARCCAILPLKRPLIWFAVFAFSSSALVEGKVHCRKSNGIAGSIHSSLRHWCCSFSALPILRSVLSTCSFVRCFTCPCRRSCL